MSAMVESSKHSSDPSLLSGRRKPLQLLSGIFSRKSRRGDNQEEVTDGGHDPADRHQAITIVWGSEEDCGDSGLLQEDEILIPEPREALHSPYHAKTIDQDMEHLRLSRQDNPYLQILASRECLHDSDNDCSEYEEKHLMSKENVSGTDDPLTLAEVHARLVRSPPPIMWTRSRNSEPSFSRMMTTHGGSDCVFQFPPSGGGQPGLQLPITSPTHSFRSQHSGTSRFHNSSNYYDNHGRLLKDAALEALSGRFNLSPQPRRRPAEGKARGFSDLI